MCRLKGKRRKMRQRSKYTDTPMGVTEAETWRLRWRLMWEACDRGGGPGTALGYGRDNHEERSSKGGSQTHSIGS